MFDLLKDTVYPNPAKTGADMYALYNAPQAEEIRVVFYSIDGRQVLSISNSVAAGYGKLVISPANLAPGVYFYSVVGVINGVEKKGEIKKLVLSR
jgi:hypothetical protein